MYSTTDAKAIYLERTMDRSSGTCGGKVTLKVVLECCSFEMPLKTIDEPEIRVHHIGAVPKASRRRAVARGIRKSSKRRSC